MPELKSRVGDELFYAFKVATAKRKTTMQEVIERAVRDWIDAGGHKVPQPQQATDQSPQVVVHHADVQPGPEGRMIEPEGYVMAPCPTELYGAWTAFVQAYERRQDPGERAASLRAEAEALAGGVSTSIERGREDREAEDGTTDRDSDGRTETRNPRDKPKPRKRAGG